MRIPFRAIYLCFQNLKEGVELAGICAEMLLECLGRSRRSHRANWLRRDGTAKRDKLMRV